MLATAIATLVLGTLCLSWRISYIRRTRPESPFDGSDDQFKPTDLHTTCPVSPKSLRACAARRCRSASYPGPSYPRSFTKHQTHERRRLTRASISGAVPQSLRGMPGGFGQGQQGQQHTGRGGANRLQNGKLGKATGTLCFVCCAHHVLMEAYSNTSKQWLWLGFWWCWPYECRRHPKPSDQATGWPGGSNICAEPNRLYTSNTTGPLVSATCFLSLLDHFWFLSLFSLSLPTYCFSHHLFLSICHLRPVNCIWPLCLFAMGLLQPASKPRIVAKPPRSLPGSRPQTPGPEANQSWSQVVSGRDIQSKQSQNQLQTQDIPNYSSASWTAIVKNKGYQVPHGGCTSSSYPQPLHNPVHL